MNKNDLYMSIRKPDGYNDWVEGACGGYDPIAHAFGIHTSGCEKTLPSTGLEKLAGQFGQAVLRELISMDHEEARGNAFWRYNLSVK